MKEFIDMATDLGWVVSASTYSDGDQYIDLYYMPNSGEDFGFTVFDIDSIDDIAKDVDYYYESFDIEEHVTEWLEAKRSGVVGVPSLMTLIDGAKEIDEKLKELSYETRKMALRQL